MNDDITGIFADLTPEGFAMRNTAIHTYNRVFRSFDEFVDDMNNVARFAFAASAGEVDIMIVVTGIDWVRYYQGYPDETLAQMISRVRSETPHATMAWMMQRTECGFIKTMPQDRPPINDTEGLEEARMFGNLVDGLFWYGRSTAERRVRSGYMIVEGDKLGDMLESPRSDQPIPLLEQILH